MLLSLIFSFSVLFATILCAVTVGFAGLGAKLLWLVFFAGGWVVSLLLCFLAVWIPAVNMDPTKEQDGDDPYIRAVVKLYAPAVFKLLGCRIEATGTEKLPRDGRFLLVCNHLFDLDPGIPLTLFPDAQLAFISKKENLQKPIVGPLMLKIQCQLIDRENDRAALKTILKCIQLIKDDEVSVAVFPEGYTSKDGRLQHFRAGAFKIAMKTGVPIVVCTIAGSQHIFHNLAHLKPSQVKLHLVGVISPEEQQGRTAVELSDQAHQMMLRDLGPEYEPIDN